MEMKTHSYFNAPQTASQGLTDVVIGSLSGVK
jgi:hypothetical protein